MISYPFYALNGVVLTNGYSQRETAYGQVTQYEDQVGLELAITKTLLLKNDGLSGDQFRAIRHALDLTQVELANVLRVSDQTVARWEKGESSASHTDAFALRFYGLKRLASYEVQLALSIDTALPFPANLHFSWANDQWICKEFPQFRTTAIVQKVWITTPESHEIELPFHTQYSASHLLNLEPFLLKSIKHFKAQLENAEAMNFQSMASSDFFENSATLSASSEKMMSMLRAKTFVDTPMVQVQPQTSTPQNSETFILMPQFETVQ
jgi:DNA-binding transcriptional regulator YiaG